MTVTQRGPRFDSLAVGVRLAAVVESGRLTEGPYVRELEGRLSEMSGVTVRAVASGAAALDIVMEALRITGGAQAIGVPTIGHWTDMATVLRAAHVVEWYGVDGEGQGRWTSSESALWVNIGGNSRGPDLSTFTVCDASHVTGDPSALAWGDIAVASLYATKVLTAGEGGLVATARTDLVPLIESLRDSGRHPSAPRTGREPYPYLGTDRRMPELSAALACASLDTLEERVAVRRSILSLYAQALPRDLGYTLVDTTRGAFKALVACVDPVSANDLRDHLEHAGVVPASGVFELALPDMGPRVPHCPEQPLNTARLWAACHVSLPIHEAMTDDEIGQVCGALAVLPA